MRDWVDLHLNIPAFDDDGNYGISYENNHLYDGNKEDNVESS